MGHEDSTPVDAGRPVHDVNKVAAAAFMETYARTGTLDLSHFTDDAIWWTFLTGEMPIAAQAASSGQTASRMFAGPGRFEIKRMIAEGKVVAVEALGFQPLTNGRSYDNTYVWVIEYRDGLICRVNAYFDPNVARKAFAN